MQVLFYV